MCRKYFGLNYYLVIAISIKIAISKVLIAVQKEILN